MARALDEVVAGLPAAEQTRLQERAAALAAEAAALRELRALLQGAQGRLADRLGVNPGGVAKMERRVDAYLDAVRDLMQEAGGQLDIVVRFPDRAPVAITQFQGLSGADDDPGERE